MLATRALLSSVRRGSSDAFLLRCSSSRITAASAASPWATAGFLSARRWARPASFSEIQQALNTLDVSIDVKEGDLKKSYLALVRKNHPDKPGGSEAKMKDITTSYNLIKGLSESDKKQYRASRDYGPGSAFNGGPSRPHSYNNPHDAHDAYRRKYEQQQQAPRGYYKYDPNMGNYSAHTYRGAANPYAHNPFEAAQRDLRALPFGTLMFRAALIYLIASVSMVMLWRIYKDYTHDDGWALSQASWRSERMESLHRMRQEARERANEREAEFTERRRADVMRQREMRAMEYAKRREQEMVSADHGCFPRLNPEGLEGLIMRDYNDPIGMAYYVPALPNGAPPFSGNGRFMYSTGSIPRQQCIPTPRVQQQSSPSDGASGSLRAALTLGDMARPQAAAAADRATAVSVASLPRGDAPSSSVLASKLSTPPQSGAPSSSSEYGANDALPLNMQRRPYTPKGIELVAPSGYTNPPSTVPVQRGLPPPPAPYIVPPPPPIIHAIPVNPSVLECLPPNTPSHMTGR